MSIAIKAVRGAAWTIGAGVGSRLIGVVGTLALTRFLAPEVVGEVAVASVLVVSASTLSTIGFGQYVVSKPDATRRSVFHATVFNLIFALLGLGLIVLLRDPLGPLFDAPTLARYVPGLALAALFDRVSLIPARVLARDLRFHILGIGGAGGEIAYTAVSVGLAVAGWGGEAIVWGNLARGVVFVVLYVGSVQRRDWLEIGPLERTETRTLFRFGVPLAIGNIAHYAARRWDNLLFAHMFGTRAVGLYNLSYNLADIPATHIGEHIGDVLMPSFARMEDDQRRQTLVRATAILGLIVFPMAIGLSAVSGTLVSVLFNAEWQGVAPFLVVLAGLSVVRPVGWTINSYLIALDLPRSTMVLELVKLALLFGLMLLLGWHSPLWATAGVGLAFGVHALASVWVVHQADDVPATAMLTGMLRPLLACAPMAGAVLGARWAFASMGLGDSVVQLAGEIAAGGIVYVVAALVIARETAADFLQLLKKAYRRGDSPD